MAQVKVQGVEKTFGTDTRVLKGIDFTVKDGEFVSLLGPSGCGKTTLLRIIAGLECATAGKITIGDADVTDASPKDRDIAMVFQNYALYPHLKVEDNIGMGLKLRKFPKEEIAKRVREAADMLELEDLLDRKPSALSGGQRQRVALARALVRQPKAYLLDEPLSNLDAVLRDKTRGELKLLFKRVKGTAIYVTHDQVEAMTLSDRIVVLNAGVIQQIGAPEEIYHQPANIFVASFLGSPPMNIFPLADAEEVRAVDSAPGRDAEKVLCGVRPEDIAFSKDSQPGYLPGQMRLAEPTGANTVLSFKNGQLNLRGSYPGSWDSSREEVWFRLRPERLHFFDKNTERRIEEKA